MDAQQQEAEARKLVADAESRRQQATRFEQNSNAHANIGDESRADVERRQAEQLAKEAEDMEYKAHALQDDASLRIGQARNIKAEIERKKAEHKKEIDDLERQLKVLVGSTLLL